MKNIAETSNMNPEQCVVINNLEHIIRSFIKIQNCVVLRQAKYSWPGVEKEYEPDISLICGLRRRKELCYTDVPRFIAEVLSDSTEKEDRGEKMDVYANVGVEEYWFIDWRVPQGRVERYLLDDSGEDYLLHDVIDGSKRDELHLILFPTVQFSMTELINHLKKELQNGRIREET